MNETRLTIVIESDLGARATDVAEILKTTSAAFDRFTRSRFSGARPVMTIVALDHGSLKIVLGAIDLMDKLSGASALVAPFAVHMAELARAVLQGGGFIRLAPPERKMLQALAGPVAKGHARQINFIVSEGASVVFDAEAARILTGALTDKGGAFHEAPVIRPSARNAMATTLAPALKGPGVPGTALLVRGEWYARLVEGQRVLVPIDGGSSAGLEDGTAYLFRGTLDIGRHGEVVGLNLASADRLGR